MKGVIVIGEFRPSGLGYSAVKTEFISQWGDLDIWIRQPVENNPDETACRWHHDCGFPSKSAQACSTILLWSNIRPTEFKRGDRIWQPQPFEVVLVDNTDIRLFHRRNPEITQDDQRWTIVHRSFKPSPEFAEWLKGAR